MRWIALSFTCLSLAAAPTSALAQAHAEGIAAGRAANAVSRTTVNEASARAVVPGYTRTPPETAHYRQPNLAGQASARLALCATSLNDPTCQAQLGAAESAAMARPPLSASDAAAVATAAAISRSPSSVLESIASYYSGCATSTTAVPAGVQSRSCLRYEGVGAYRCTRSLTVGVDRSTTCTPGEWFAQAASGGTTLAVQCQPDRAATAQRYRVSQGGSTLAHFDVDMTAPVAFPQMAAVLSTSASLETGAEVRTGVWVADKSCGADSCSLTALIAAERGEACTGSVEGGFSCVGAEPFRQRYAACPAGTQSGDLVQETACSGDSGCLTTALDGTRCYAPSATPTGLTGTDVTGSIAGYFWSLHGDRPVIGWDVNPQYVQIMGPLPTMQLEYVRPSTSFATSDRWDDQCPAVAGGRCSLQTAAVCTDGPATRVIDGIPVTRDCWQYERTMSCSGTTPASDCSGLASAGCTPGASVCRRTNPASGSCEVWEDSYSCPVPAGSATRASNCPSTVFCLQGNCFDIASPPDPDFARSMSLLEAAREAGVYLDTDTMQVFNGEANRCRDRLLTNCCDTDNAGAGMTNQSMFGTGSRLVYDILMNAENRQFVMQGMSALLTGAGFSGSFTSYGVTVAVNGTALPTGSVALYSADSILIGFDPWSLVIAVVIQVVMSATSCDEEEGKLAMKEGARLCHTVGTYCSSCIRVLGSCVSCITHTTRKCCFNSILARIVNEQGRVQVGRTWGTAREPDCSGFTVAQLQALDFSAMDLSELYASLVPTLPNVPALQGQSAARVPACYYGQGRC
jgi:conjugal transfer mating pair stabilization protein TraN